MDAIRELVDPLALFLYLCKRTKHGARAGGSDWYFTRRFVEKYQNRCSDDLVATLVNMQLTNDLKLLHFLACKADQL